MSNFSDLSEVGAFLNSPLVVHRSKIYAAAPYETNDGKVLSWAIVHAVRAGYQVSFYGKDEAGNMGLILTLSTNKCFVDAIIDFKNRLAIWYRT